MPGRAVEKAAGTGRGALQVTEWRHELGVSGRLDDLTQRDVIRGQGGGVDQHLDLAILLPNSFKSALICKMANIPRVVASDGNTAL